MLTFLRRPLAAVYRKDVGTRYFSGIVYQFVKRYYNRYSKKKVEKLGPDRAAAKWLIRCAASFRPKGQKEYVSTKKQLRQLPPTFFIESIDASDSIVHYAGFEYLNGLKHLKELKLHFCYWVDGRALTKAALYCPDSLERLEIVSCGNLTAAGLMACQTFKKLKVLYLCALPLVNNEERVVVMTQLRHYLPRGCQLSFPDLKTFDDMLRLRPK